MTGLTGTTRLTGTTGTTGGHRAATGRFPYALQAPALQAPSLRAPARHNADTRPPRSVARLLDLSPRELNNELRSGKSLNDLAEERGVPHDELIASILGRRDAGAKEKRMAEKLASLRFPPPPQGEEREKRARTADRADRADRPDRSDDRLGRLSSAFGTDPRTLRARLAAGMDLISIAQRQGVDLRTLAGRLEKGDIVDRPL